MRSLSSILSWSSNWMTLRSCKKNRIPNIPVRDCPVRVEADWKISFFDWTSILNLFHCFCDHIAGVYRVWSRRSKRQNEKTNRKPLVTVFHVLGWWGFTPPVGHMVLIREGREEMQPACRANKIQCCINISHPLHLCCCVCLHMLLAMWTTSVLTEALWW